MSLPSEEEREKARAMYIRLLAKPQRIRGIDALTFVTAWGCVDVALRVADHLADTFGLPRFDRSNVDALPNETTVEWIDRVALDIAQWRGDGIEESEKRGTLVHRERRSGL